jgi:hypothetical protein
MRIEMKASINDRVNMYNSEFCQIPSGLMKYFKNEFD